MGVMPLRIAAFLPFFINSLIVAGTFFLAGTAAFFVARLAAFTGFSALATAFFLGAFTFLLLSHMFGLFFSICSIVHFDRTDFSFLVISVSRSAYLSLSLISSQAFSSCDLPFMCTRANLPLSFLPCISIFIEPLCSWLS